MKWIISLAIFITAIVSLAFNTANQPLLECEVLLEKLQGEYVGDCKKGVAHGNGKAVGKDTYEGAFKKGLPHGAGTYTWSNGDVYKGEFNKGQKSGEGELTFADGSTPQKGFWLEDEYIGSEKTPYKVINKTVSVNRVSFKRISAEPNQLDVKFTRLGKPVKGRNVSVQGSYGVITNQTEFNATVKVHTFPMQGGLSFSALANRDAGGRGGGEYVDGNFEFKINQAGSWEVVIEMQGTD